MASVAIDDRLPTPDEEASRLYEAHAEWLLRYCLHQLRDHADAEDAVQIVFLYAFRALRRGVVPECERAWLTTIARNVCHTQRRTRERHPEAPEAELDRIALARPDNEEAGFLDEVRAALAALPENQRRALLMREWQGASSGEIADRLELSEPATHALLFRARRSFVNAMSASRSVAGLNVAAALHQLRSWLKPLLESATVKAAVATTAAGVAVVGAVVEQRIDSEKPSPSGRPASAATLTSRPQTAPTPAAVQAPEIREREGAARGASPRTEPPGTRVEDVPSTPPLRDPSTPKTPVNEPASEPVPAPPTGDLPSPPPPAPAPPAPPVEVPPVEPPALPPIELPPILGQEPLPPIELPPLEEVPPPIEAPPVPPLLP